MSGEGPASLLASALDEAISDSSQLPKALMEGRAAFGDLCCLSGADAELALQDFTSLITRMLSAYIQQSLGESQFSKAECDRALRLVCELIFPSDFGNMTSVSQKTAIQLLQSAIDFLKDGIHDSRATVRARAILALQSMVQRESFGDIVGHNDSFALEPFVRWIMERTEDNSRRVGSVACGISASFLSLSLSAQLYRQLTHSLLRVAIGGDDLSRQAIIQALPNIDESAESIGLLLPIWRALLCCDVPAVRKSAWGNVQSGTAHALGSHLPGLLSGLDEDVVPTVAEAIGHVCIEDASFFLQLFPSESPADCVNGTRQWLTAAVNSAQTLLKSMAIVLMGERARFMTALSRAVQLFDVAAPSAAAALLVVAVAGAFPELVSDVDIDALATTLAAGETDAFAAVAALGALTQVATVTGNEAVAQRVPHLAVRMAARLHGAFPDAVYLVCHVAELSGDAGLPELVDGEALAPHERWALLGGVMERGPLSAACMHYVTAEVALAQLALTEHLAGTRALAGGAPWHAACFLRLALPRLVSTAPRQADALVGFFAGPGLSFARHLLVEFGCVPRRSGTPSEDGALALAGATEHDQRCLLRELLDGFADVAAGFCEFPGDASVAAQRALGSQRVPVSWPWCVPAQLFSRLPLPTFVAAVGEMAAAPVAAGIADDPLEPATLCARVAARVLGCALGPASVYGPEFAGIDRTAPLWPLVGADGQAPVPPSADELANAAAEDAEQFARLQQLREESAPLCAAAAPDDLALAAAAGACHLLVSACRRGAELMAVTSRSVEVIAGLFQQEDEALRADDRSAGLTLCWLGNLNVAVEQPRHASHAAGLLATPNPVTVSAAAVLSLLLEGQHERARALIDEPLVAANQLFTGLAGSALTLAALPDQPRVIASAAAWFAVSVVFALVSALLHRAAYTSVLAPLVHSLRMAADSLLQVVTDLCRVTGEDEEEGTARCDALCGAVFFDELLELVRELTQKPWGKLKGLRADLDALVPVLELTRGVVAESRAVQQLPQSSFAHALRVASQSVLARVVDGI